MDQVWYLKDPKKLEEVSRRLFSKIYPAGKEIIVKLHFGEEGNKTAFFPKDVEPIINALKSLNLQPTLLDTPVAYDSPRNTIKGYLKVARDRGYEALAPIKISSRYKKYQMTDIKVEVAQELVDADNVLVISHVKGHPCSGFGGAIKNLGMGGVSKRSKNLEHNLCKPLVGKNCSGCGTCVKLCPAQAIQIIKNKAKVDRSTCWGCSICELSCPSKALTPKRALFDALLAQGASAAINNMPKQTFYINIIQRVTKTCDCDIDSGAIIAKDCGILFSSNPIALDIATVDLVNKLNQKEVFRAVHHKDPLLHVDFAALYTGMRKKYSLKTV